MNSAARTQSLWMIGASLAFTGMVASIKLAAGRGVPLAHIIFYRGVFSVLVMSAYLRYRNLPLGSPHWRMHLRRGAAGYGGLVTYVAAVSLLPLATAVSLNYTSPLLLAAMLAFLHRERPERAQLFALAGGLCGIVLLLRPTFDESQWFAGLIALFSAVLAAWTALNIRALGRLQEDPARTVLYFSAFITVATLPWFLLSHPAAMSLQGSLAVLAAAVFAAFGQIMLTLAYQRGHTMLVSLLGYSQVVFTSIVGIVVWNDHLPVMSWIGMALVIASGGVATLVMRPASPIPSGVALGPPARSADIEGDLGVLRDPPEKLAAGHEMSSTRRKLLDLIIDPDAAYALGAAELEPLQLQAAQELFETRRQQIPLLERRAEEAGIHSIRSFEDLVPLLFAHTVYKSYPASFVEQGRWDRLLQWLNTLSVPGGPQVDTAGVKDIDEWIERLWPAGRRVLATSGTSGKCSFLNQTDADFELKKRHFRHTVGWPLVRADGDHIFFWLGPIKGPNSAVEAAQIGAQNWARAGEVHALSDEPLKVSEVSRMAALRKRIAAGEASPGEIAQLESVTREKGQRQHAALIALIDRILDYRRQPIYVSGMWAQYMMLISRARERGIQDGEFNPQSVVFAGGGVKGIALPPDYQQQVQGFFGSVVRPGAYGMTELMNLMPRCEAGRYHRPPGLITLVLDRTGERLLTAADASGGLAEGRFGFLDLGFEGRWGGLISGDKVTVDFAARCACGRPGPTLLDNITRWAQTGEDDHIGCAGTIDNYIRGAVGE